MEIEAIYTTLGIPAASAWVLNKLCGAAVDVAGEILADRARLWRLKNLISILAEAGEYATRAGLDLKQIPLKVIFPLLEGASLEEEPELRSLWARLLANGSATGASISIIGIAGEMLRALSPSDAKVLDAIYVEVQRAPGPDILPTSSRNGQPCMAADLIGEGPFRLVPRTRILEHTGLSREHFEVCYDSITRFNVIEAPQRKDLDGRDLDRDHYAFTRLGWRVMNLLKVTSKEVTF